MRISSISRRTEGITPCEGRVEPEVHDVISCCQGINQRSN